jgi:hypothetical protein
MLARATRNPIAWASLSGVVCVDRTICKNAGGDAWNAGASSVNRVIRRGVLSFSAGGQANTYRIVGLSNVDADHSFNTIDFGIYLVNDGTVQTIETGSTSGTLSTYTGADRFSVEAIGATVRYYKNGVLLRTSGSSPTYPLLVDTSLFTVGAIITDVALSE